MNTTIWLSLIAIVISLINMGFVFFYMFVMRGELKRKANRNIFNDPFGGIFAARPRHGLTDNEYKKAIKKELFKEHIPKTGRKTT